MVARVNLVSFLVCFFWVSTRFRFAVLVFRRVAFLDNFSVLLALEVEKLKDSCICFRFIGQLTAL